MVEILTPVVVKILTDLVEILLDLEGSCWNLARSWRIPSKSGRISMDLVKIWSDLDGSRRDLAWSGRICVWREEESSQVDYTWFFMRRLVNRLVGFGFLKMKIHRRRLVRRVSNRAGWFRQVSRVASQDGQP